VTRILLPERFCNVDALTCGLTPEMVSRGVEYAHDILDTIDEKLIEAGAPRISGLVELANLSSITGNLVATGIVNASDGIFERAGPHQYQDLRASGLDPNAENVEIKVALEKNKPKGHLAKAGYYLTCRYVLCDENGKYTRGERGSVVYIWEIRFGRLENEHFDISNTEGDSGKTAVVNKEGMKQLTIVYFDEDRCPFASVARYKRDNGLTETNEGLFARGGVRVTEPDE
jgi:hypothetical protein